MINFTPTERRILHVLRDGNRHTKAELQACLEDELAGSNMVSIHVRNLRKKLNPLGMHIVCEVYLRVYYYRQVRLLAPATDGTR